MAWLIPATAVAAFLGYLWFISGVVPYEERYPTGELKSAGYVKRQGWRTYLRHGHWVSYHKNGAKAAEGFYAGGEKRGEWRFWDEEGHAVSADARSDNGTR